MNRTHTTTFLGLVAALLCASCASLPGAWYYQSADAVAPEAPDDVPPGNKSNTAGNGTAKNEGNKRVQPAPDLCDTGLYFAVLNNRHDKLDVTKVEINGGDASGAGWTCVPQQKSIKPGQLLVLKLPLTEQATCAVPIDAELWTRDSRRHHIKVSAAMPSALPKPWQQCPAPGPTCPQTPEATQQRECNPGTDM